MGPRARRATMLTIAACLKARTTKVSPNPNNNARRGTEATWRHVLLRAQCAGRFTGARQTWITIWPRRMGRSPRRGAPVLRAAKLSESERTCCYTGGSGGASQSVAESGLSGHQASAAWVNKNKGHARKALLPTERNCIPEIWKLSSGISRQTHTSE